MVGEGGFFRIDGESVEGGHAGPGGIAQEDAGDGAVIMAGAAKGDDPVHALADEEETGAADGLHGLEEERGDFGRVGSKALRQRVLLLLERMARRLSAGDSIGRRSLACLAWLWISRKRACWAGTLGLASALSTIMAQAGPQ